MDKKGVQVFSSVTCWELPLLCPQEHLNKCCWELNLLPVVVSFTERVLTWM